MPSRYVLQKQNIRIIVVVKMIVKGDSVGKGGQIMDLEGHKH